MLENNDVHYTEIDIDDLIQKLVGIGRNGWREEAEKVMAEKTPCKNMGRG